MECMQNFDGETFEKGHLEEDNIEIAVKKVGLINECLGLATAVTHSGVPVLLAWPTSRLI
jgi:hypothetical protein